MYILLLLLILPLLLLLFLLLLIISIIHGAPSRKSVGRIQRPTDTRVSPHTHARTHARTNTYTHTLELKSARAYAIATPERTVENRDLAVKGVWGRSE